MFLEQIKAVRVSGAVVAGTDSVAGTIDVAGFESVLFLVLVGAITADAAMEVAVGQGAEPDGSDQAALDSPVQILDAEADSLALVEVVRPVVTQGRYLTVSVNMGQDAAVDGIIALLFNGRKTPRALEAALVAGSCTLVSPAFE